MLRRQRRMQLVNRKLAYKEWSASVSLMLYGLVHEAPLKTNKIKICFFRIFFRHALSRVACCFCCVCEDIIFFCRPLVIQQAVSWSMRIVDKCISILERSCEMLLGESTASGKLSLASVLTLITVAGCFCLWATQSYIVTVRQEWRARLVGHRSYFQPVGQSNIVDFNDFKRERFIT